MSETLTPSFAAHGAARLPAVDVISYALDTGRDDDDLRADGNKDAVRVGLERLRKPLRKQGEDPFGEQASEDIGKKELDAILTDGDPEAAGILHGAVEDVSQTLARTLARLLKVKSWRDVDRAVIGGMRANRVRELIVGRADMILKARNIDIRLSPLSHASNEAGLIGAVHLVPSWMFKSYDALLAVDIGPTGMCAGIVAHHLKRAANLAKASVEKAEVWEYPDDRAGRDEALKHLGGMLRKLIGRAEEKKIRLAPLIGVGCPARIDEAGTIEACTPMLPRSWSGRHFNLPSALREAVPTIGEHDTAVVLHNRAVVQGLSELPFIQYAERWGGAHDRCRARKCVVQEPVNRKARGARLANRFRFAGDPMEEYLIGFVVGGVAVSAFAALGDAFRPKTFAGLTFNEVTPRFLFLICFDALPHPHQTQSGERRCKVTARMAMTWAPVNKQAALL